MKKGIQIIVFIALILSCNEEKTETKIESQEKILSKDSFVNFDLIKIGKLEFYKPRSWENSFIDNVDFYSMTNKNDSNSFFTILVDSQYRSPKKTLREIVLQLKFAYDSIKDYSIVEYNNRTSNHILFIYTVVPLAENPYETCTYIAKKSGKIITITYRYKKPIVENSNNFEDFMRISCSLRYNKNLVIDCEAPSNSKIRLDLEDL